MGRNEEKIMARLSVDEIQSRVASITDQDEDTSALSADDYSLRLKYINTAQDIWAETYPWQTLYAEYNVLVSTASANASIALPNNFRKIASYPQITYDGTSTAQFPEVLPQEDSQFTDTDKRIWIMGDPQSGYIMRVFGVNLVSGASVKVPYTRSVGSLASPADISIVPNADYLVKYTVAQIWESREDPRFPNAKAEATRTLSNMLEFENVHSRAADYGRVKTVDETKYNFRIGRD